MTTSIPCNLNAGLQKLRGVIANYKCTRTSANFVFTKNDQNALGVVAIAASIAGLSGMAVSTAGSAGAEEDADYLEFDLGGKPVKGFVWRSPFREGDAVEVIAEWHEDRFELFAMARPQDRIVALYPHCSRGRKSHWKNAFKSWFLGVFAMLIFISFFMLLGALIIAEPIDQILPLFIKVMPLISLVFYSFFFLMTISLARKWMSFVRLAERIFVAFDWKYPSDIDLNERSKVGRTADDPTGYGNFFFRY